MLRDGARGADDGLTHRRGGRPQATGCTGRVRLEPDTAGRLQPAARRLREFAMVVALLSLELHVAGSRSLKDKRMVLRSVKDRLRKHNVAVAELDHQDLWQRAGLGIVTIAATEALAERELEAVVDDIERNDPGVVSRHEIEFLA